MEGGVALGSCKAQRMGGTGMRTGEEKRSRSGREGNASARSSSPSSRRDRGRAGASGQPRRAGTAGSAQLPKVRSPWILRCGCQGLCEGARRGTRAGVPCSPSASHSGASAATAVGFLVAARSASGGTYVPDHGKVAVHGTSIKERTVFPGTHPTSVPFRLAGSGRWPGEAS